MGREFERKLDYDDYAAAPSDGQRYEIIRGEVFVAPVDLILTPHDIVQPDLVVVQSTPSPAPATERVSDNPGEDGS